MLQNSKFEKYKSPLKLGLIAQVIFIIVSVVTNKIYGGMKSEDIIFLFIPISIIIILLLFKKNGGDKLKWFDFNVVSFMVVAISSLTFMGLQSLVYEKPDEVKYEYFILSFIIYFIPAVIVGIFLEKGPFKTKLKRLLSIVLFVWAIYKLFTSFSNAADTESKSAGVDTDGDGVNDTFDTDGDGIKDTSFMDSDGDGISDMIAKDSDGDGLVDKVFADMNKDGKIDSFVKDIDKDGFTDIGLVDTDSDGQPDKLI